MWSQKNLLVLFFKLTPFGLRTCFSYFPGKTIQYNKENKKRQR